MIPQCGHEDCNRSSYAGCLHDTSALNTALMIAELNKRILKAERELDEINGKILVAIAQALNEATKLQKRNELLEQECQDLKQFTQETIYRQSWPEGSVKRENTDLRRALKVKARQAEGCEAEIAELGKVRDQLHSRIKELQKRNEYLEHELIALGHVNCEWCCYWKKDEDSSDEGVCELVSRPNWGMFRIDHREYGQAMAGHVLKTLCNFGCKEGKAKPIADEHMCGGK